MSIHSLKRSQLHLVWDKTIPPVFRVKSGDTVDCDCLDSSNGQITESSEASILSTLAVSSLDPVHGPIYVESAAPGDVLQVDILKLKTADWGWTALIKGFGLLADEFPDTALRIWDLREGTHTWFDKAKGIKIPLRPFPGEMGTCPAAPGPHSTIPPFASGGNIDTKHMYVGTTLYLPVEVEGALFSIGDGHASQGEGEVCGTAIETPMTVTVRLTVLKDKKYIKTPHYSTPFATDDPKGYYATTGVGPDIREAARDAVRHMIAVLCAERDLTKEEAYMLCSVVGDLRMHEVVDMPNYVIGFMMPKSIFGHKE